LDHVPRAGSNQKRSWYRIDALVQDNRPFSILIAFCIGLSSDSCHFESSLRLTLIQAHHGQITR